MRYEKVREVRLQDGWHRWRVRLEEVLDERPSRRGLALRIFEDRKEVYLGWGFRAGACTSEDSDEAMASFIALACHAATHDENDRRVEVPWDAEGLADAAYLRWEADR